jgi:hypothetical protein
LKIRRDFTADVRAWFNRSLRTQFTVPAADRATGKAGIQRVVVAALRALASAGCDTTVDDLLAWFDDRAAAFCRWDDYDAYQGDGFPAGEWCIEWGDIEGALCSECPAQFREIHHRAVDDARYATLEDWLRADIADTLVWRGADGGMSNVPVDVQNRLYDARVLRDRARRHLKLL